MPHQHYFSLLNNFIIEISNRILKFTTFLLNAFLNIWNLKFFNNWIRFWIIFYKIDMHPMSCFSWLRCSSYVAPCAQVLVDFCALVCLTPFKTMLETQRLSTNKCKAP